MAAYLSEIERAATSVLDAAWAEHRTIRQLEFGRLRFMDQRVSDIAKRQPASGLPMSPEDSTTLEREMRAAEERLRSHRFSIASLAASVLQFAKQGISIVHGGLSTCPPGRLLGSQSLRDIIWQARNQSIHWENNVFHEPTAACFERLAAELEPRFGDFRQRNMAFDILLLLGWSDFEHMAQDLKHLERQVLA